MLRNNEAVPSLPEAPLVFIIIFGVALPVLTMLVELFGHLCAGSFFDPFPTIGHVFGVAAVPAANIFTLWALSGYERRRLDSVIFAQAVAVAVAGVYTLIFLPLLPFGIVGLVVGMGLLPLTPVLALWASLRGLLALRRLRDPLMPGRRSVAGGLAAGVGVLLALQLPTAATRVLVAMAASDTPSVSHTGLHWLRRIGQRDLLLRACYQGPGAATDLPGTLVNLVAPVDPQKAREIYYRVTGRPFETEPGPRLAGGRGGRLEENEWDVSQGGSEVGVLPLRGLSLASSRLDGSVDGRAALAYLEWTFELRNEGPLQREARAEVALPPGAVVSRVTLWIDGVEQEAAFAGREVTRRAYQRVVQRRRDPILVTTTGPDRVMIQCFPVPPLGGVMKARLGITAPLHLESRAAGTLGLPHFVQRNFGVPAGVGHAVWIATKDRFVQPAPPLVRQVVAGGEELRGRLPEPARPGPLAALTVERADVAASWTADRGAIVRQTWRSEAAAAPARLVVVIDGSAAMAGVVPAVEAGLRALPAGRPVAVLVAGDRTSDLLGGVAPLTEQARAALSLRRVSFEGGADSVPALLEAWDRAAEVPGSAVLWIHGPQAVVVGPVEDLLQRFERRPDGPIVHSYAAVEGENRLLAALAGAGGVRAVPRLHDGGGDLAVFAAGLAGDRPRLVAVRERLERGAPEGVETSDHLARLWAHDRIDVLLHGPRRDRAEALALASRYHLVTPVSGAVVLETQQQYEANDLEPPVPGQVPTVPEPGTWALLALVALVLVVAVRQRRSVAHAV